MTSKRKAGKEATQVTKKMKVTTALEGIICLILLLYIEIVEDMKNSNLTVKEYINNYAEILCQVFILFISQEITQIKEITNNAMVVAFNEKKIEVLGGKLKEEKVETSMYYKFSKIETKKHINIVVKMLEGPLSGFEKELMPRPVF